MEKVSVIWVYILRGENGKYYTGITNSLRRRLKEHRDGNSRSTRRYGAIELMWVHAVQDRKMARELEVLIKHKGAKKFLERYGNVKLEWPSKKSGIKTKGSERSSGRGEEKGQEKENRERVGKGRQE